MAVYTLPDLSYDYAALEPHLNGQILELHHGKHHAAYVKGANDTLDRIAEARDKNDFAGIVGLEKTLAFNVSGHILHTIYWSNMSPDGGGRPESDLADALTEHFGSFEAFHGQLSAATTLVQGSGWGVLSYEPLSKRLIVEQVYDHHGNVAQGSVPLLAFDAWEHAYYLQYKNVRPDFVKAMWEVVKLARRRGPLCRRCRSVRDKRMSTPGSREELVAAVLPPAMELAAAYTTSGDDPGLFWDTMRRAISDAGAGDPAAGTAQLLFGLSALSGILLDQLAEVSGQDRSFVLAQIHQLYLPPQPSPP